MLADLTAVFSRAASKAVQIEIGYFLNTTLFVPSSESPVDTAECGLFRTPLPQCWQGSEVQTYLGSHNWGIRWAAARAGAARDGCRVVPGVCPLETALVAPTGRVTRN